MTMMVLIVHYLFDLMIIIGNNKNGKDDRVNVGDRSYDIYQQYDITVLIVPWSSCPPDPLWQPILHCLQGTEMLNVSQTKYSICYMLHVDQTKYSFQNLRCYMLRRPTFSFKIVCLSHLNIVCVVSCLVQGNSPHSIPRPEKVYLSSFFKSYCNGCH